MSIIVSMSDLLKRATGHYEMVELSVGTPQECLQELVAQFPVLNKWLYEESGKLKPHVWLLVNDERIYEDEFDKLLNDADQLSLMVAVLGG